MSSPSEKDPSSESIDVDIDLNNIPDVIAEEDPKQSKPAESKKPASEDGNDKIQSYCHLHGEWDDRRISIFGAVKSFITQLRAGQDLTRVSLPCIFLRPYSLLEEVAARQFAYIYYLLEANQKKTPLKRMLSVLRWLIASAKQENFHHKPFNPIIGEINRVCYDHDKSDPKNITYFVVEQVKHHPPTCGIRIDNPSCDVSLEGHYTFQVQFNRNSVTVANNGRVVLRVGKENYVMEKAMPDMLVKNLIIGSKLVVWEGPIAVFCKETGYRASATLSTKGRDNVVKGGIYSPESETEPLVFVEGKCGGATSWRYNTKHPNFAEKKGEPKEDAKKKKEKKKKLEKERGLLGTPDERESLVPAYPQTQESNSSINTWAEVAQHIIANDMVNGDLSKQKIEEAQRTLLRGLEAKGETFKPVYFEEDKERSSWKIVNAEWWKDYKH